MIGPIVQQVSSSLSNSFYSPQNDLEIQKRGL
jgi:hypothetical protein